MHYTERDGSSARAREVLYVALGGGGRPRTPTPPALAATAPHHASSRTDPAAKGVETMTVTAFLSAAYGHVLSAVQMWGFWAPRAWCRKQRRRLAVPGGSVVWIRRDVLPWAEWGARRGYFEVQYMDGLPYLRALGAPGA